MKICRTFYSHFMLLYVPIYQPILKFIFWIISLIFFEKANSSYTIQSSELSAMWKDKMFSPLEEAHQMIERLLKFKTLRHLRMERHDLSLLQYFSIDAILVMSGIFGLWIITIVMILKRILWTNNCRQRKLKAEWKYLIPKNASTFTAALYFGLYAKVYFKISHPLMKMIWLIYKNIFLSIILLPHAIIDLIVHNRKHTTWKKLLSILWNVWLNSAW